MEARRKRREHTHVGMGRWTTSDQLGPPVTSHQYMVVEVEVPPVPHGGSALGLYGVDLGTERPQFGICQRWVLPPSQKRRRNVLVRSVEVFEHREVAASLELGGQFDPRKMGVAWAAPAQFDEPPIRRSNGLTLATSMPLGDWYTNAQSPSAYGSQPNARNRTVADRCPSPDQGRFSSGTASGCGIGIRRACLKGLQGATRFGDHIRTTSRRLAKEGD